MKSMHALRYALAFLVTFLIVEALGIHERSWPLITVTVVLLPICGRKDVLYRAAQRICGTFMGAAIGVAALNIEIVSQPAMMVFMAMAAAGAGYAYHGKYPYAAMIVGVTMAVVVNAPAGDTHVALMRILGVCIGSVIATVFGLLFVIEKPVR